eukprot:6645353-Prorocentrum_lima.AAC.1
MAVFLSIRRPRCNILVITTKDRDNGLAADAPQAQVCRGFPRRARTNTHTMMATAFRSKRLTSGLHDERSI